MSDTAIMGLVILVASLAALGVIVWGVTVGIRRKSSEQVERELRRRGRRK